MAIYQSEDRDSSQVFNCQRIQAKFFSEARTFGAGYEIVLPEYLASERGVLDTAARKLP